MTLDEIRAGMTPGEWEVAVAGLTDEGIRWIINGAGDAICRLQSKPLGEQMRYNAALIALAPAMLDAVDALLVARKWMARISDEILDGEDIRSRYAADVEQVDSALAKIDNQTKGQPT